ncbi:MAG: SsrA-binding protein SmpB [Patescibacteria group bacterium]
MPTFVENRQARFRYEIMETLEAGIELVGHEVKAIKHGRANLAGSFVIVRGGEVFLSGATISPYQPTNLPKGYEPARLRRLLLTKKEITDLTNIEMKKGLTIIPLQMYTKGRSIKLTIGIARGRKGHDKREHLKRREVDREIRRTLKWG